MDNEHFNKHLLFFFCFCFQLEDNEDNIREEWSYCYVVHEKFRHNVFLTKIVVLILMDWYSSCFKTTFFYHVWRVELKYAINVIMDSIMLIFSRLNLHDFSFWIFNIDFPYFENLDFKDINNNIFLIEPLNFVWAMYVKLKDYIINIFNTLGNIFKIVVVVNTLNNGFIIVALQKTVTYYKRQHWPRSQLKNCYLNFRPRILYFRPQFYGVV